MRSVLRQFVLAVVSLLAATVLRHLCDPLLGSRAPLVFHLFAVAVVAQYGGLVSGLTNTLGSIILIDLLFIQRPPNSLIPAHHEDIFVLLVFAVVCIALSLFGQRRKRAEEALGRINRTMVLALEAGRSGAWELDVVTGELIWSENYYRLLGVDSSEKPTVELFLSMVHPDDREALRHNLEDLMHNRVQQFRHDFRITLPDGVRWFERMGQVTYDDDGKPIRIVGISTDITERRVLRGLLPTCAECKKIRDENDQWHQLETYITRHSQAKFSHGLCPACANAAFADLGITA